MLAPLGRAHDSPRLPRQVRLVEEGCKYIIVLGVDFMSENVRAVLDAAGHTDVPVYRLAEEHIGCSLAEAAESDSYFRCAAADTMPGMRGRGFRARHARRS